MTKYSAGTIFLQVSPVFRKFQDDIRDYVQDMDRALGDEMEKAGEKAGKKAGKAIGEGMSEAVDKEGEKAAKKYAGHFETNIKSAIKSAEREISRLDLSTASKPMLDDLDKAKKKLRELNEQDFDIDFDANGILADLVRVRAAVEGITRGKHEINVQSNMAKVGEDIDKALGFAEKRIKETSKTFEREFVSVERKMGAFEKSFKKSIDNAMGHLSGSTNREVKKVNAALQDLHDVEIGVDMSAGMARQKFQALMAELDAIASNDIEIDAKFEAGRAYAEMAAFGAAAEALDGKTIKIDVDSRAASRAMRKLTNDGNSAANSFRSFNIMFLAAATLGPPLIPIFGAVAGGLLAIASGASVAAFGIGAVIVGFGGIGDALGALADRQDQQARSASDAAVAQQSASYAVADAQRALRDAQRNAADAAETAADAVRDARKRAADAVEDALDRQTDAQESYRDAIDDVREAERQLKEARREAATTGDQIDLAIRENALAIDQGMLDAFDATVSYNSVIDDGSATNAEKEQARINKERAQMRLDELRAERQKLAADKKKWDKEGVNGTQQVQRAEDQLSDAVDRQRKAYEDMGDAARAVDEARRDGAERVNDALEAQNDTLADNARSIARAEEAVRRAGESAAEVYEAISTEQEKVNDAFDKLSPAGRRFARFLFSLRDGFYEFRAAVQQAMLPAVQEAMEGFIASSSAGSARRGLIALAAAFGEFSKAASESLQGPAWTGFFDMLSSWGPRIFEAFGGAFLALFEALASIMTTLAPFTLAFAEGFERMMESFAGWAESEEGQAGLLRFVDHLAEIGPSVLKFIGVFAEAFTNLMVALAPYAGMMLGLLTGILEWMANLDPDKLGAFAAGLLIIITSSQLVYGMLNIMLAGMVLLSSTFGVLAFAAIAIGLALAYVYTQNEGLAIVLGVVAGAVLGVIAAVKIYRGLMIVMASIQLGFAAASYGAAGATYAQAGAARAAYVAARIWAATQWLVTAALNGTLFKIIALNVQVALSVARYYAVAAAMKVYRGAALLAALATGSLSLALLSNPLTWVAIAVIALVGTIIYLWKTNETFRNVIIAVWEKVKGAFSSAWDVIGRVLGWIDSKVTGVFRSIQTAWTDTLWPVIKAIGKAIFGLWKFGFKVYLTLMLALFKALWVGMKWIWDKGLKPLFGLIADGVMWLWKKFRPALTWIGDKWDDLMTGMKKVWDRHLAPVFQAIADKVLPKLQGAFEKTIDRIKSTWEGLKKVIAKPIKFVIEKIINGGLIKGLNSVAKWVGKGDDYFDDVPVPKSLQSYASGGIMPGYTPGRDVHTFVSPTAGRLELSGGEAVMRPEFTAAVGPGWVDKINGIARTRGTKGIQAALGLGGPGSYYVGGVIPLLGARVAQQAASQYGGYAADLNVGSGSDDYGMPVRAWKSGIIAAMRYIGDTSYGRWMDINHGNNQSSRYAHLSGFKKGLTTGQRIGAGDTLGYVGSVGNSSAPHLHFEINGGNVPIGDAELGGGGGGGGGPSLPGMIKRLITSPIKTVKGWISNAWGKATDFISDSPIFDVVKSAPNLLIGGIKDKAMDIIPGWARSAAGVVDGVVSKGADIVGGAIGKVGDAAEKLGFADGGILPYNGTMKYDAGGYLPPGLTTVVNLTGKPEPVFTSDQWATMGGGRGGDGIHYEPHFNGSNLTAEDVAGDLNFTFRRIRRAGKYAGVGDQ